MSQPPIRTVPTTIRNEGWWLIPKGVTRRVIVPPPLAPRELPPHPANPGRGEKKSTLEKAE